MEPSSTEASTTGTASSINPSGLDPMDVDPIDGGPKPQPQPLNVTPPPLNLGAATTVGGGGSSSNTSTTTMNKEEEARQAIDMLRGDDLSNRVAAAHRLDVVASALGEERTREVNTIFLNRGRRSI